VNKIITFHIESKSQSKYKLDHPVGYCADIWTQTRRFARFLAFWLLNVRFTLLLVSLSWLMIRVCLLMVIF